MKKIRAKKLVLITTFLVVVVLGGISLTSCAGKKKYQREVASSNPCRYQGDPGSIKAGLQDCYQRGNIFFDMPSPSMSKLNAGPALRESLTFLPSEELYCSLFIKSGGEGGKSRKFRCYRTNEKGEFYDKKGALVTDAYGVNASHQLVDKAGTVLLDSKGKPRKADKMKIKYTLGSSRDREVFTEVAATRFFWLLGLASDHMYPLTKVTCFGCGSDPFKEQKIQYREKRGASTSNDNQLRAINPFTLVALERKFEGEEIETNPKKPGSGFTWDEVAKVNPAKAELQAMVIANNIIAQGSDIAKQQALSCGLDGQNSDGTCAEPWPYTQDVGASFGSRSGFTHPRGDYAEWSKTPVMSENCGLKFPLGGFSTAKGPGYRYLMDRLSRVTFDQIRAIVEVARFDVMDPDFTASIAKQRRGISPSELKNQVLNAWAQKWWEKIQTVTRATQCN